MLRFRWFNVQTLELRVLAHGFVQIGCDKGKRALHVIDHVTPAGVDVADQHPPTRMFAGIGDFLPETQNENLIEQRSL